MAGILLEFTGHSTRSASTSAAAAAGLSLDLIVEAGEFRQSFFKNTTINVLIGLLLCMLFLTVGFIVIVTVNFIF